MKIRNIKINFDQIVLFLILLPVFVDQINGFMQAEMNLSFSVGQAVKFFYMLGLTVFLVRSNRKVTVVVLYVFSMLSIPVIITIFSKRLIYLSVFSDLIFIFKLTTFLITFYVMRYLFTNYRQYFNEDSSDSISRLNTMGSSTTPLAIIFSLSSLKIPEGML